MGIRQYLDENDELIGNKTTELLLREFKGVENENILFITDYDKTLTPRKFNSWDYPYLVTADWDQVTSRLRKGFAEGEISETEYWQDSIDGLNDIDFYNKVEDVDHDEYQENFRRNVNTLFEIADGFGETLIYSAGVGEVIEFHIKTLQNNSSFELPSIVANFQGKPLITSSTKDGKHLENFDVNLNDFSHIILLGDSVSDSEMIDGYTWDDSKPVILKLALLGENQSEARKDEFLENYDILFIDDVGMSSIPDIFTELTK